MAERSKKDFSNVPFGQSQFQPEVQERPSQRPEAPARAGRVYSIPLSQCQPDRFQSRDYLPEDIKKRFYAGEIDCYEAARDLIQAGQDNDLLRPHIQNLIEFGENILERGQIQAATGKWDDSGDLFLIEAGERRFWSLAVVRVVRKMPEELNLKVTLETEFSLERQIAENIHRQENTAVDIARSVARLILSELNIRPDPESGDDYDYLKKALEVRLPRNTWPKIEKTMQASRTRLVRHLKILSLPRDLILLARVNDLPESQLREILSAPEEQHRELITRTIREELTAKQIREIIDGTAPAKRQPRPPQSIFKKTANRYLALLKLARKRNFDRNFKEVAYQVSEGIRHDGELVEMAEVLEQQAAAIREVYDQRQKSSPTN